MKIVNGKWSKLHVDESIKYISKYLRSVNIEGDLYEFGAYRGEITQRIEHLFRTFNLNYHKMYGFDSFEGLPEEAEGIPKHYIYSKGAFCDTHESMLFPLYNGEYIKGWFNQLNAESMKKYNFRPARFVHVDCDLYISTIDALGFMFDNKLIQKNCIVAFDEYKSVEPLMAGGEAKAWAEICEKYKVKATEFFRNVYQDKVESWQNAWLIEDVHGS